ncbi:hypothetical protein ACWGN5_35730 [Streptomyces sp. NPDC055815]
MDVFRKYFEDNPEIFTGLVAVLALIGALLGSVIGAKIQANGGRDQAAAAREAARIAAEAQRVAALWTVRQVQIAEFVRSVRELMQLYGRLYTENDAGLYGQVTAAYQAVTLRKAEIDLIASGDVAAAADAVLRSADTFVGEARHGGLMARLEMTALRSTGVPGITGPWPLQRHADAQVLNDALAAFIEAARALLKSEEDVAPTVPQRRRWWRAA